MSGVWQSVVEKSGVTLAERERARLGWLALVLTPGLGALRIKKAMERLGTGSRVFEASLTELEASGMPARSAQFVADGRAEAAAEEEMKRVREAGGLVLAFEDEGYPEWLRE